MIAMFGYSLNGLASYNRVMSCYDEKSEFNNVNDNIDNKKESSRKGNSVGFEKPDELKDNF